MTDMKGFMSDQIDLESYEDVVPKRVRKLLQAKVNNIILHGAAGTGKSTILRAITKHNKNSIVLAPTGIAALNVGGQTLHSFFGFGFGYLDPTRVKGCPRNFEVLRKRPLIIIDEVSMVRADVFNAIDKSLQLTLGNRLPFAGLQVLLLGDTGQLPPVVNNDEQEFFAESGSEMFFNSPSYVNGNFKHIELETVHRQTNAVFIDFLLKVRERSARTCDLDWFNSRITVTSTQKYFKNLEEDSTVLCMTNARADMYNENMYDKLTTPEVIYTAQVSGRFNESEYPTHEDLRLKIGTKVVLLKNAKNKTYVNGSVGIISKLERDHVFVTLNGVECKVEQETWEKYAYVDTPDGIEKQTIGKFKQIPVRLAWAVTVHKSQGMTLKRFHLDLERRSFVHGQMYVALSRARSVKGISMTRELEKSDILVDRSKLLQPE